MLIFVHARLIHKFRRKTIGFRFYALLRTVPILFSPLGDDRRVNRSRCRLGLKQLHSLPPPSNRDNGSSRKRSGSFPPRRRVGNPRGPLENGKRRSFPDDSCRKWSTAKRYKSRGRSPDVSATVRGTASGPLVCTESGLADFNGRGLVANR